MSKIILITGSTDGIGKLAAIRLAKDGYEVLLHGRNEEKVNRVIGEVKEISNNEKIKGFVADFSDLEAVRKMGNEIKEIIPKIDVLINNAGVYKSSMDQTNDGYDMRFVVNYFAPYVLTQTLMPLLENGTAPRIINLSSAAQAPVSLDALAGRDQIPFQAAYAQSKLALTMWSFDLANTHPNMTVIAVNPGSLLDTNMVREGFGRVWSSADKGGNILYDLAVDPAYEKMTGKYFDNDKGQIKGAFGDAHGDAYDKTLIEKLIKATDVVLRKE